MNNGTQITSVIEVQCRVMNPQAIRDLMFGLLAKGRSKTEIANVLGVKRNIIHRWLRVGNVSSAGPPT